MKQEICHAFCGQVTVRQVPAGLAVGTAFDGLNDDRIGFYVIGPDPLGKYRIEDNGMSVAFIEAEGADLASKTRREVFRGILDNYDASYNEETGELTSGPVTEAAVAEACLRFMALLLRIQDVALMTSERVVSTFREDALRALKSALGDSAVMEENAPVSPALAEIPADVVIRARDRAPVAVFFGTSDQKVLEAMLLQTEARHVKRQPCSVIALIENNKAIGQRMFQRASNRLTAVPIFRGDEEQSILRIREEALGAEFSSLH
jgi:hypothetical protein